ncbi:NAD(+) diphosphatase [Nocardioides sp. GY 10113]|uniref:NAD(+) diphosphatase n=1 Tax=Nocardioides sp. GY 10113 TaxID=2569761 RepID=UPI0010A77896|nr:NAD(+) diphosphatase [Nocardioides sp. GY 10113]TIC81275.1 NAD(+) diphosphatase [Nocardioides sp. GY 10113]
MSLPHLDLSRAPHERHGLRRTDEGWLADRWAAPDSRVLVVAGTRIRPGATGPEWAPTSLAPEGTRVFLGERAGVAHWAVIVPGEVAKEEPGAWVPLRGLLPYLAATEGGVAPLLFHAIGIAEWLWATRFCPRCGGPLEVRAAGHELHCTVCGKPQFPRSDPAVIMLVTDGEPGADDERCLLGRNPAWPAGRYSTLAGFCEPGETLEDAVRREVQEETGVLVGEVAYFGNQPWPLPASLMLGFFGRATDATITLEDADVEDARWLTREEMRAEAEDGGLVLPGGVSISRSLIEQWYGGALPGSW